MAQRAEVVDLTDDGPVPTRRRNNNNNNESLTPIGVDICPDIVDLMEDEEEQAQQLRDFEFCSEDFAPWTSLASLARSMAPEESSSSVEDCTPPRATSSSASTEVGARGAGKTLIGQKLHKASESSSLREKGHGTAKGETNKRTRHETSTSAASKTTKTPRTQPGSGHAHRGETNINGGDAQNRKRQRPGARKSPPTDTETAKKRSQSTGRNPQYGKPQATSETGQEKEVHGPGTVRGLGPKQHGEPMSRRDSLRRDQTTLTNHQQHSNSTTATACQQGQAQSSHQRGQNHKQFWRRETLRSTKDEGKSEGQATKRKMSDESEASFDKQDQTSSPSDQHSGPLKSTQETSRESQEEGQGRTKRRNQRRRRNRGNDQSGDDNHEGANAEHHLQNDPSVMTDPHLPVVREPAHQANQDALVHRGPRRTQQHNENLKGCTPQMPGMMPPDHQNHHHGRRHERRNTRLPNYDQAHSQGQWRERNVGPSGSNRWHGNPHDFRRPPWNSRRNDMHRSEWPESRSSAFTERESSSDHWHNVQGGREDAQRPPWNARSNDTHRPSRPESRSRAFTDRESPYHHWHNVQGGRENVQATRPDPLNFSQHRFQHQQSPVAKDSASVCRDREATDEFASNHHSNIQRNGQAGTIDRGRFKDVETSPASNELEDSEIDLKVSAESEDPTIRRRLHRESLENVDSDGRTIGLGQWRAIQEKTSSRRLEDNKTGGMQNRDQVNSSPSSIQPESRAASVSFDGMIEVDDYKKDGTQDDAKRLRGPKCGDQFNAQPSIAAESLDIRIPAPMAVDGMKGQDVQAKFSSESYRNTQTVDMKSHGKDLPVRSSSPQKPSRAASRANEVIEIGDTDDEMECTPDDGRKSSELRIGRVAEGQSKVDKPSDNLVNLGSDSKMTGSTRVEAVHAEVSSDSRISNEIRSIPRFSKRHESGLPSPQDPPAAPILEVIEIDDEDNVVHDDYRPWNGEDIEPRELCEKNVGSNSTRVLETRRKAGKAEGSSESQDGKKTIGTISREKEIESGSSTRQEHSEATTHEVIEIVDEDDDEMDEIIDDRHIQSRPHLGGNIKEKSHIFKVGSARGVSESKNAGQEVGEIAGPDSGHDKEMNIHGVTWNSVSNSSSQQNHIDPEVVYGENAAANHSKTTEGKNPAETTAAKPRFKPQKRKARVRARSNSTVDDEKGIGKPDVSRPKLRPGNEQENKQKPGNPSETTSKSWFPKHLHRETRYIFHATNDRTTAQPWRKSAHESHTFFNFSISNEDAEKEQERLLRESAARLKFQAKFTVASQLEHMKPSVVEFAEPIQEIEKRYPNHWQFKNPHSRLGLPKNASVEQIKSHYRRLALAYHPDKSRAADTELKFQEVTEAYRTLLND
jgi:DnaJ-domain-containing protein 1